MNTFKPHSSLIPHDLAYRVGGIGIYFASIPPMYFGEHAHRDIEIAIPFGPVSGPATLHSDVGTNITYSMQGDHLFVLPSYQPHTGDWRQKADNLLIYLDPDIISHAVDDPLIWDRNELTPSWTADDKFLHLCASALQMEFISNGFPSRLYLEASAMVIGVHLLRTYATQTVKSSRVASRHLSQETLSKIFDYIHHHLAEDVSVIQLSSIAAVSLFHFSRLFKQTTGRTPHQFLLFCRIERAKQLFMSNNLSISQVSDQVGFFDASHLTKTFQRLVGISPRSYRAQIRKNILD